MARPRWGWRSSMRRPMRYWWWWSWRWWCQWTVDIRWVESGYRERLGKENEYSEDYTTQHNPPDYWPPSE